MPSQPHQRDHPGGVQPLKTARNVCVFKLGGFRIHAHMFIAALRRVQIVGPQGNAKAGENGEGDGNCAAAGRAIATG